MNKERRHVFSGDQFTSDELDRNEIELQLPEPSPEPAEDEQTEPWGSRKHHLRRSRRLRAYDDFLDSLGYDRERDRRGDQ